MRERTITVFGSGTAKEGSREFKMAYQLGYRLAQAGFTVANGGYGGTMLAAAQGAKAAGGRTVGVTTDDFPGSVKNPFIDREIRKPAWRERLHRLIDLGDGFAVLDGGTGTLAELLLVWEMGNKNFHKKPVAVLGRRMKSAIKALKRNPEVKVPSGFRFVSNSKAAVDYLVRAAIRA